MANRTSSDSHRRNLLLFRASIYQTQTSASFSAISKSIVKGIANRNISFILAIVSVLFSGSLAYAACPLPNNISNGQLTDATKIMGNLTALQGCVESPQLFGLGGGVISLQNPSAASNYNFNFPTTAGNAGDVLTSGGGASAPNTWTPTGTSGHVLPLLDGANTWSGTQSFGSVIGTVSTQTGTSYTLASSDCGTTILFTSNTPISLTTLNSIPIGCAIGIEQAGNGQVTVTAGTGATQHSAHGYTKTYGPYAILGLFVDANTGGTAADFIITGDGA